MKLIDKRWRVGIDLGGTKVEGILLDPQGRIVFRKRIKTQQKKGYAAIMRRIHGLYDEILQRAPLKRPSLGIGTPGAISQHTGLLKNSNTLCLNGKPLQEDLKKLLKRPLTLENDANCFALAEAHFGAGRGAAVVFGVIMGTGCGGGLIFNGKLWKGHQAIAGEWGHMAIDPRGPQCYCGSRGCVETLISGGGLESSYRVLFRKQKKLKDILVGFRHGYKNDKIFMNRFFKNFGRSLANLIHVIDPDVVVLGGGVSNIGELYTEGVSCLRGCFFSDSMETRIVKNELGDSAGVLGAALLGAPYSG